MSTVYWRYERARIQHQAALEELADAAEEIGGHDALLLELVTLDVILRRTLRKRMSRYRTAVVSLDTARRLRGAEVAR